MEFESQYSQYPIEKIPISFYPEGCPVCIGHIYIGKATYAEIIDNLCDDHERTCSDLADWLVEREGDLYDFL